MNAQELFNMRIMKLAVKRADGTLFKALLSEKGVYTNFFHDKKFISYEFPTNWWAENIEWDEFVNLVQENDDAILLWDSLLKALIADIAEELHNFKNN
jgi:hypothetical protein